MANTDFSEWLLTEIESRGLSYSEVARRGGLSHARISQVISGSNPGADFCTSIARALDLPPERVFRIAGLLPPRIIGGEHPEQKAQLLDYFEALDERGRDTALAMLRTLYEQRGPYAAELRPDKDKED